MTNTCARNFPLLACARKRTHTLEMHLDSITYSSHTTCLCQFHAVRLMNELNQFTCSSFSPVFARQQFHLHPTNTHTLRLQLYSTLFLLHLVKVWQQLCETGYLSTIQWKKIGFQWKRCRPVPKQTNKQKTTTHLFTWQLLFFTQWQDWPALTEAMCFATEGSSHSCA